MDEYGEVTCTLCIRPIGWVLTDNGFHHVTAKLLHDGSYGNAMVVCEGCAAIATAAQR